MSIAAETTGALILMFLENIVDRSTSLGKTSLREGIRRTSSKVRPSGMNLFDSDCMADVVIIGKDK